MAQTHQSGAPHAWSERTNSFMMLTIHKAASSYVGQVLTELFDAFGYRCVDLQGEAFSLGMEEGQFVADSAERFFEPGCFFGPLRGRPAKSAAQISPARPIIHVRDPRDCLVSHYYSIRDSHPVPNGERAKIFLANRERAERITVDEYVEMLITHDKNMQFKQTLQTFIDLIKHQPHCIVSKYEKMVTDFEYWIYDIVSQFGIAVDYSTVIDLIERTNPEVNFAVEENVQNHKRQVTPGDHARKLAPRTVSLATEFFSEELKFFGYLN